MQSVGGEGEEPFPARHRPPAALAGAPRLTLSVASFVSPKLTGMDGSLQVLPPQRIPPPPHPVDSDGNVQIFPS